MKKSILCFVLLLSLVLCSCSHRHFFGETEISASDCNINGYVYRICKTCGEVEYLESIENEGHIVEEYFDDMRFQARFGYCAQCGIKVQEGEYEAPKGIDRLYVYGVPEGSVIPIELTYVDGEQSYNIFGYISKDGNESNGYSKKDYDLSLYSDRNLKEPISLNFDASLSDYDTYALKSEYADKSSVRNLTASDLWSAVVSTRKDINENLAKLPGFGADSGFPILMYTNDNFKGVYNLCKPNDEKLFELAESENGALVYTYPFFGSFDFRVMKNDSEYLPCQVIYPTEKDGKSSATESFSRFYEFVLEADDERFKNEIENYLDVSAAIDYLLCIYAFGADANVDLYCNWVTYDGEKWIPSMYNLTHTFGIDERGNYLAPEDSLCPEFSEGVLTSGTANVLWDKLCKVYSDEICERYSQIRTSLLTPENITAVFEGHAKKVLQSVYDAEMLEYPEKNYFTGKSDSESIRLWTEGKMSILDKVLLEK